MAIVVAIPYDKATCLGPATSTHRVGSLGLVIPVTMGQSSAGGDTAAQGGVRAGDGRWARSLSPTVRRSIPAML